MRQLFFIIIFIYMGLCHAQDLNENTEETEKPSSIADKLKRVIPEEKNDMDSSLKKDKQPEEITDPSKLSQPTPADSLQTPDTSASSKDSSKGGETQKPNYILKTYKDKAISGETGYNSLVGTGIIYHYFVEEHISIEAGFGGSSDGFTPGVRGRMEIGIDPIPYWGAIGLSYSFGSFIHVPVLDKETRRWPKIRSLPIPRVHLQVGTQVKLSDESFVLAYIGYSLVLTSETWKPHPDDVNLISDEGAKFFDSFFGSGPSIGVAFGMYPF